MKDRAYLCPILPPGDFGIEKSYSIHKPNAFILNS